VVAVSGRAIGVTVVTSTDTVELPVLPMSYETL